MLFSFLLGSNRTRYNRARAVLKEFSVDSVLGSITLVDSKPNYLKYAVNAPQDQLTIFSEIYYPKGWDVYIAGMQAEYIRANYALRAMKVPTGVKTIEFKFEPAIYSTGQWLAGVSSVIVLLLTAGILYWQLGMRKGVKRNLVKASLEE